MGLSSIDIVCCTLYLTSIYSDSADENLCENRFSESPRISVPAHYVDKVLFDIHSNFTVLPKLKHSIAIRMNNILDKGQTCQVHSKKTRSNQRWTMVSCLHVIDLDPGLALLSTLITNSVVCSSALVKDERIHGFHSSLNTPWSDHADTLGAIGVCGWVGGWFGVHRMGRNSIVPVSLPDISKSYIKMMQLESRCSFIFFLEMGNKCNIMQLYLENDVPWCT